MGGDGAGARGVRGAVCLECDEMENSETNFQVLTPFAVAVDGVRWERVLL